MKKIVLILLSLMLIIAPVMAFPGMGTNNTTDQPTMDGMTSPMGGQSVPEGHEIVAIQHVVEFTQEGKGSESTMQVREAIAMRNLDNEPYAGQMRAWVPSDAEVMAVVDVRMHETKQGTMMDYQRSGNDLTWNVTDPLGLDNVTMVIVQYRVPFGTYEKHLKYPTGTLYLRSRTQDVTIQPGGEFTQTESTTEQGQTVQTWEWQNPRKSSFTVRMSVEQSPASYLPYVGVGLIVVGLVAYPLLRQRLPAIREFESRILPSKDPESLKAEKEAILDVLAELEDDYEAGHLDEEEYEALRERYQQKAKDIMKKIDKLEE